ncbi:MAG TPA: Tol-Pal system protein TolB, partial [Burkholderiales bacterium]|nr:Tol-Pal system protein TolB [Burkholderiales bacterium]
MRPTLKAILALGFAVACGCAGPARAQLSIEIIGGGANQIPITILPFGDEDRFTQRVSQIVSADLQRSGLFRLGSQGSVRPFPVEANEVDYRYWHNEGAD